MAGRYILNHGKIMAPKCPCFYCTSLTDFHFADLPSNSTVLHCLVQLSCSTHEPLLPPYIFTHGMSHKVQVQGGYGVVFRGYFLALLLCGLLFLRLSDRNISIVCSNFPGPFLGPALQTPLAVTHRITKITTTFHVVIVVAQCTC